LLSTVLAGMPAVRGPDPARDKRCTKVGKRCGTDGECCSGFCEPLTLQCAGSCATSGTCGTLEQVPCAKGCSCYSIDVGEEFAGRACLRNPTDDLVTVGQECPGTKGCAGPHDCPKDFLCTPGHCCGPDAVCLRLCDPDGA
jgi:hypothetical protein